MDPDERHDDFENIAPADSRTIVCRAKVSTACLNGQSTRLQFGEPDLGMAKDGTFDGESIVCDSCYIKLMPHTPSGRALHHELDDAIATVRLLEGTDA